jgi:hypothetical protein
LGALDELRHTQIPLADAAAVRLPPAPRARVYHGLVELSPEQTVARAGLTALERVDLVPEWPDELT